MKYVCPVYDLKITELDDILLASKENYEIVENSDGTGNVIFDTSSIF